MSTDLDIFKERLARTQRDRALRRRGNIIMVAVVGLAGVIDLVGAILGIAPLIWITVVILMGWMAWDQRRDEKLRRARDKESK